MSLLFVNIIYLPLLHNIAALTAAAQEDGSPSSISSPDMDVTTFSNSSQGTVVCCMLYTPCGVQAICVHCKYAFLVHTVVPLVNFLPYSFLSVLIYYYIERLPHNKPGPDTLVQLANKRGKPSAATTAAAAVPSRKIAGTSAAGKNPSLFKKEIN